jgi:enoyl-CoA hydratase/carnithine racemase
MLAGADRVEVRRFLGLFNDLVDEIFSYLGPTAAAIGGHAVAGGCLLAMSCDLRVMATGRPRIGLSELNLGVPVPARSLLMLNARLAPNVVEELVVGGDGCTAERARNLGIVHRTTEPRQLVATAERELRRLASRPAYAFSETKNILLAETLRRMKGVDAAADEVFLDCWFADETQRRIKRVVDSLGG